MFFYCLFAFRSWYDVNFYIDFEGRGGGKENISYNQNQNIINYSVFY
jgi:hypothetical protein